VMEPSDECPSVGNGQTVNPTAAVRVPLPLNSPISWQRHVESIPCDWGRDSTIIWPDTIIIWPDSSNMWPDSGGMWPDSSGMWPDSMGVWPDSSH
jgi:hypothetical protein